MKKLKFICITAFLINSLIHFDLLAQKRDNPIDQMLANSHPGANHAQLDQLTGTWNFQDSKLVFVKGTLVRKPMYDGRFYMVEIIGGKLQLPVADGKMKEDRYQSLQIEGYDNVKSKFITISLNNHIGSDIQYQLGIYDANKKTFTYDWDSEMIKGEVKHNRRIITLIDGSHYTESFYELKSGQYINIRTLLYSKSE
ncbi:DUF1579 family protein [Pedobacter paludis]|uniref:DUF1579 domain-containing protein n=1 Tax=Pedobacter paludis TaxID=2203212 RepID=A0A317EUR8_9SPHI|nr:DUF1579 family protein [Pedobacter paludis]PWS29663.1 hypothetical protein DF947_21690 [Pedobacter paludis]